MTKVASITPSPPTYAIKGGMLAPPMSTLSPVGGGEESSEFFPASSGNSVICPTLVDESDRAPDGGTRAWLVVLGSFMIHCFCFGPTEYIFPIFEHGYLEIYPHSTPSSIAFIGTLGSSTTYFAGFLSGIAADRFGYRITALIGTTVMTVALVLASLATKVWQLYLTQGVLFGLGASLVYYPAIGAPSHWFDAKRGIALGLAISGTGIGGLILSPVTQMMMDRLGIHWTLRALALFCLLVCGTASFLIVERQNGKLVKEPTVISGPMAVASREQVLADMEKNLQQQQEDSISKQEPSFWTAMLVKLKIFKDPQFVMLTLAELVASIAFLIPMYYFQTYSVFIGLTPDKGALIAGLSSGASCMGRIVLGFLADKLPRTFVVTLCAWCTALSILIIWTLSKSFGIYLFFALTYGFFAGGYVSLVPLVLSDTFGSQQLSSTVGMLYFLSGLGMLGGAPLAGHLLEMTGPHYTYLPVIMTAGGCMLVAALCITGWGYFRRQAKKQAVIDRQVLKERLARQMLDSRNQSVSTLHM